MENIEKIPTHVGFIMDGNGRWAKLRNKPRNFGHKKGADRVEEIVSTSFECGVKCVSLYAFSTENWARPKQEVDKILDILRKFLDKYLKTLMKNQIKLVVSGNMQRLPEELQDLIKLRQEQTSIFNDKVLNIALNYGSRQEIVDAVNLIIKSGKESVCEEDISNSLYTKDLPDIDLVVRTSGEQRLSNFFLWQCAYAEFYFTDVLWPDFDKNELLKALDWYKNRDRRFGKV